MAPRRLNALLLAGATVIHFEEQTMEQLDQFRRRHFMKLAILTTATVALSPELAFG